jgi:hypothetical protein
MKKGVFGEVVRLETTDRASIGADGMVTCTLPSYAGMAPRRTETSAVDRGVQH